MPSVAVTEFMLIIAVVVLGLIIFAFLETYLLPQYAFTLAEQQARTLASATFISVSPPATGSSGYSFVVYPYIPGFKGNVTVFAFVEPQSLLPSVSLLTPQSSQPEFIACYPGGKVLSKVNVGPIYDTNGNELVPSLTAYTVPANTPFVITANIPKGDVLIIWIIYYGGGYGPSSYYFRIAYAYTTG